MLPFWYRLTRVVPEKWPLNGCVCVFYVTQSISSTGFCIHGTSLHKHTHPFSGPFSGTTRVSRYQKGKSNLDFTEARDSEWQWHQLGHMQVCNSLQTDNHASTPPLSFLPAGWHLVSCKNTHQASPTFSQKAWTTILSVDGFEEEPEMSDTDSAGQQSKVFRNSRGTFWRCEC